MTRVLAALLTIAAAVAGHTTAWAASTFSVTSTTSGTTSTFTITRSGDTSASESVMYRTVSLSAIAGQHFTEKSGTLTFAANETSKTVSVTESTPGTDAYKYQTASSRTYRFEVTDLGGYVLAYKDRSITNGLTQFSGAKVSSSVSNLVTMSSGSFSSSMSSGKYLDVSYTPPSTQVETSGTLSGYVLIDDSYDYAQKPATVSTSSLISSTGAPASYLNALGYKIYATVCFTEKEKDDGYQYVQIVAGTSSASYDGADPNGAVNDPSNSVYKVCFELADGSNAEGKAYFPHHTASTSGENADYGSDNFSGKYFVLADDIAYTATTDWDGYTVSGTENNFTPIGGYGHSFRGHFDGKGHTVSDIRVYKDGAGSNNNDDESIGLFGYVSGGTVQNIVLRDSKFRGSKNIGGIVGYNSGTVTNCTLYHVLTGRMGLGSAGAYGIDVVAGYQGGTVTGCYYLDCLIGTTVHDPDNNNLPSPITTRYDNVFTLTTADNTSATYDDGATVTIDGVTYYAEGSIFTIGYTGGTVPDGFMVTYTATAGTLSGTALTMAASDTEVSAAFAPDYATHWHADADHDGTEAKPYIITTATGLNLLATLVNGTVSGYEANDFSGTFFKLGGDITYTSTTDWDNTELSNEVNNFAAIGGFVGTTFYPFSGTFDGDGHTVSGIRITQKTRECLGLFGFIGAGGTVKNLTLSNARIYSNKTGVGGIAGRSRGTIANCHVTADVNILGNGSYHGGIAGSSNGDITGCTSAAALNWSGNYRGGITGQTVDGTLSNCIVTGVSYSLDDNYYLGAIVGNHMSGTLSNNYYRNCSVNNATTGIGVGTSTAGVSNDTDGARSVHTLTLGTGITATGGETVTIGGTTYYAAGTTVALDFTGTAPADGVDGDYYFALDGAGFIGNTFTMPAKDAEATVHWTRDYAIGHAGTEADPYVIMDYPQLELLAKRVNEGSNYSYQKFFKLGADITCYSGENNHTPIGTDSNPNQFIGTFDGQGYTISGVNVSSSDDYQGLFGKVSSGGTVKNVTLANSTITGHHDVGGIAGNNRGTVTDCRVLGDVIINADADAAYRHGGIVGQNYFGTVNGCFSAAIVSPNGKSDCRNYGGIVGYMFSGTVKNSIAVGATVSGYNGTRGAIVGTNDGGGTLAANYYNDCTVGTATTDVGTGSGDITDGDGALRTDGIPLLDNYRNDFVLSRYADGQAHDFTLAGRTLYRDGDWNTLALPFSVSLLDDVSGHEDHPLYGATLMTFEPSSYVDADGYFYSEPAEGRHRSGELVDGTLYLYFRKKMDSDNVQNWNIGAGWPVIVKWPSGDNIVNPTFTGVTLNENYNAAYILSHAAAGDSPATAIDKALNGTLNTWAVTTEEGYIYENDRGNVTFRGTYAPTDYTADDHTTLFLGAANTLYYPKSGAHIGAFRAAFLLGNGITAGDPSSSAPVRAFNLGFGDGDATGITTTNLTNDTNSAAWYTLDGRKLSGMPAKSGIYIVNGRKVIIK